MRCMSGRMRTMDANMRARFTFQVPPSIPLRYGPLLAPTCIMYNVNYLVLRHFLNPECTRSLCAELRICSVFLDSLLTELDLILLMDPETSRNWVESMH